MSEGAWNEEVHVGDDSSVFRGTNVDRDADKVALAAADHHRHGGVVCVGNRPLRSFIRQQEGRRD